LSESAIFAVNTVSFWFEPQKRLILAKLSAIQRVYFLRAAEQLEDANFRWDLRGTASVDCYNDPTRPNLAAQTN